MEKKKSLYIDMPNWDNGLRVDDFLVAIGQKKSNSVYHVAEIKRTVPRGRMTRYYIQVYNTDLLTALKRDSEQRLITLYWYIRKKKTTNV